MIDFCVKMAKLQAELRISDNFLRMSFPGPNEVIGMYGRRYLNVSFSKVWLKFNVVKTKTMT